MSGCGHARGQERLDCWECFDRVCPDLTGYAPPRPQPTEAWDSARRVEKSLAGIPRPKAPRSISLDEFIDHVQAREPEQERGEGTHNADSSRARAFCCDLPTFEQFISNRQADQAWVEGARRLNLEAATREQLRRSERRAAFAVSAVLLLVALVIAVPALVVAVRP